MWYGKTVILKDSTEPLPATDWFSIGLSGVAILGIALAWRWELIGAVITIITMILRELLWVMLRADWMVEFLIFWLFVVPPAILFLVAWGLERKIKQA